MYATHVPGGPGLRSCCAFSGFTLIELLVVCSLLAAVSMLAWGMYGDVDRRTEDQLARVELLHLADALKRFRADTGYWPGEGPFTLASAEPCSGTGGAIERSWALPADDGERDTWFLSPANLALLYQRPALCTNHPLGHLENWDPIQRRGWNGPYLPLQNRHWVDLGSTTPVTGTKATNIPAFASGPRFAPADNGYQSCDSDLPGCYLGWRSLPDSSAGYDAGQHEFLTHARPFLTLGLDSNNHPRVIYWGPDGRYGGTHPDDPCLPNGTDPDGLDDQVICL